MAQALRAAESALEPPLAAAGVGVVNTDLFLEGDVAGVDGGDTEAPIPSLCVVAVDDETVSGKKERKFKKSAVSSFLRP